jgi:transcriptional regulator with XRE-family HTH domain
MYPNLKLHIFKLGIHQNRLAKHLGIADTVLSKIIHGYREPTATEREMLARYLQADEAWLFENYDGGAAQRARQGAMYVSPRGRKE